MKVLAVIEIDEEALLKKAELECDEDANYEDKLRVAFEQEMSWVQENSDVVTSLQDFRLVSDYHPGLKYPRLNLLQLLSLEPEERNPYVQLTYSCDLVDAYDCREDDLSICGTDEDGFIEEETLMDYVLGYSGIEYGEVIENAFGDENGLELMQDNITFLVGYVVNDGACEQECEHLDFSMLKLKEGEMI